MSNNVFAIANKNGTYNGFYIHTGCLYGFKSGTHYVYFGERSKDTIYVWCYTVNDYTVDEHGVTVPHWHKIKITKDKPRYKWFDTYDIKPAYGIKQRERDERSALIEAREKIIKENTLSMVKAPSTKGALYASSRTNNRNNPVKVTTHTKIYVGEDFKVVETSVSSKGTIYYAANITTNKE